LAINDTIIKRVDLPKLRRTVREKLEKEEISGIDTERFLDAMMTNYSYEIGLRVEDFAAGGGDFISSFYAALSEMDFDR
jgi:hypothetical protein